MKTEIEWYFGFDVDWIGYKQTGVWGMYCEQVRHNWFGIYWLIGVRITKRWGYDF